jgi:hypothetical protein
MKRYKFLKGGIAEPETKWNFEVLANGDWAYIKELTSEQIADVLTYIEKIGGESK